MNSLVISFLRHFLLRAVWERPSFLRHALLGIICKIGRFLNFHQPLHLASITQNYSQNYANSLAPYASSSVWARHKKFIELLNFDHLKLLVNVLNYRRGSFQHCVPRIRLTYPTKSHDALCYVSVPNLVSAHLSLVWGEVHTCLGVPSPTNLQTLLPFISFLDCCLRTHVTKHHILHPL